jgi:putative transposase
MRDSSVLNPFIAEALLASPLEASLKQSTSFDVVALESAQLDTDTLNKATPKEARDEFRKLVKSGSVYNSKDGVIYEDDFQEVLKSTPSHLTDMEADNLIRALKTVKKVYPKFKNKYKSKLSFTINRKNDSNFKLEDNVLSIVKTGTVKLDLAKLPFDISNHIIQRVTISASSYGWYICLTIRIEDDTFTLPSLDNSVGIDWGIKTFASDSNNDQFRIQDQDCYKHYAKLYKRLKYLQSILGKKRHRNKGWKLSKKYKILKFKIKQIYERLAHIRKDFLHNISRYYIDTYQTIVIENLKPNNMNKNHKLARMINEGMFYTWKVMLTYKCLWYGRSLYIINPANTSQICNKCGTKLGHKLKLSQRIFKCTCGHEEDRDINAAKNILKLAY